MPCSAARFPESQATMTIPPKPLFPSWQSDHDGHDHPLDGVRYLRQVQRRRGVQTCAIIRTGKHVSRFRVRCGLASAPCYPMLWIKLGGAGDGGAGVVQQMGGSRVALVVCIYFWVNAGG